MIGKMFRPVQVSNIAGKRGYKVEHKFFSNFGNTYKFTQEIYLNYDVKTQTETIQMDFTNLTLPILVSQSKFKVDPVVEVIRVASSKMNPDKLTQKKVYSIVNSETEQLEKESLPITTFRSISRPTDISSASKLTFTHIITSQKDESENDILIISIHPIVVNGVEVMELTVTCKTPVVVTSNKSDVQYDE